MIMPRVLDFTCILALQFIIIKLFPLLFLTIVPSELQLLKIQEPLTMVILVLVGINQLKKKEMCLNIALELIPITDFQKV